MAMRYVHMFLMLVGLLTASPAAAQSLTPVDVALVLAIDVSGSVNEERFVLQRDGYATALASSDVAETIGSGPYGRVAVTLVEWSGVGQQRQMIPWRILDGAGAAIDFAADIARMSRAFAEMTDPAGALAFSSRLFASCRCRAERLVIDVSGDGASNAGAHADVARDAAVAEGITVNGLPILTEEPKLDAYYRAKIIGGPGAFIVIAKTYSDFADAIRNKVAREIAGRPPPSSGQFAGR